MFAAKEIIFGLAFLTLANSQGFNRSPFFRPAQSISGNRAINYEGSSGSYHLSWRAGRRDLTWSAGIGYCAQLGMKMVSLDSQAKNIELLGLVTREAPYFWAGGKIQGNTLVWQNGGREAIPPKGTPNRGYWSPAGRKAGGQPEESNECLAILVNVYNDGTLWHDVGCSHRKPVVCE